LGKINPGPPLVMATLTPRLMYTIIVGSCCYGPPGLWRAVRGARAAPHERTVAPGAPLSTNARWHRIARRDMAGWLNNARCLACSDASLAAAVAACAVHVPIPGGRQG
jgi:hypothetical protein